MLQISWLVCCWKMLNNFEYVSVIRPIQMVVVSLCVISDIPRSSSDYSVSYDLYLLYAGVEAEPHIEQP